MSLNAARVAGSVTSAAASRQVVVIRWVSALTIDDRVRRVDSLLDESLQISEELELNPCKSLRDRC